MPDQVEREAEKFGAAVAQAKIKDLSPYMQQIPLLMRPKVLVFLDTHLTAVGALCFRAGASWRAQNPSA